MSGPATGIAPVHRRRLRWTVLALLLAFAAAAVVLPLINISRYHHTIAETISRSIGRPVHLGSVQLQLLPRPGLALSDFVVEEDPGFGAEPLLRAPSVTVSLRLSSLWRERLEVSRIDLDNASLNVVNDARGQWNFSSLLIQAARTPNAPTAQRHATQELRFPYIEFRSARINFKSGAEKKAVSFLNADLSIWLDQPNQWQLRFEAQPARTDLDLDLADTGLMRLEGSVNRATALDQIPVKLHAEWDKAPLGQVSRMLFGEDSGWRGLLSAEADFTGDIRNLSVNARLRVDDAHHQEFTPPTPLNIDARCRAVYQGTARSVDDLTCLWPVGDGHLLLTGAIKTLARPEANLTLEINHTPASFAVTALGLLRRGLTPSLDAAGLINGHFTYAGGPFAAHRKSPTLSGEAFVEALSLSFPGIGKPLAFPTLHFVTVPPAPSRHAKRPASKAAHSAKPASLPAHVTVFLDPAAIDLDAPNPLQLSGRFTANDFALRLAGQADLVRFAALTKSSGLLGSSLTSITSPPAGPRATANLDLTVEGPWVAPLTGASPPLPSAVTQGILRIERAQARLDWLPEPVEIASASAAFSPGKVTWSDAAFTVNGIAARGSFTHPLPCGAPDCAASGSEDPVEHFNLDIPSLDAAALQSALMGAGRHNEFLSAILAEVERRTAPWPALDGAVHIGVLTLDTVSLHDARAVLRVKGRRMEIASLAAAALGGSLNVAGSVETTGRRPVYKLNLTWSGVSVPQVAAVFHEKWGAGAIDGAASLTLEGYSASDLAGSARGTFQWDWARGSLGSGAPGAAGAPAMPRLANLEKASLTGPQAAKFPVNFSRWRASGTIADRTLKLDPADRTNLVTGTISFNRELDLSWPVSEDTALHLAGTLAHPSITSPQTPPQ